MKVRKREKSEKGKLGRDKEARKREEGDSERKRRDLRRERRVG